jgi:hypothetical protein
MKVKTLRKIDTKEFVEILHGDIYTTELPTLMLGTVTFNDVKEYYEDADVDFSILELVELELIESDVIGADIRNKLSPLLNLIAMLNIRDKEKFEKIEKYIEAEIKQCKKSINYLKDLL